MQQSYAFGSNRDRFTFETVAHVSARRRIAALLINAPLTMLLRRALRAPAWTTRNVEIRVYLVRGDHTTAAQKVSDALELIERYDPRRFTRLQQDIASILVWPFVPPGAVAEYKGEQRLCVLNAWTLAKSPSLLISLRIVHEAAHARLRGIAITADNLARIEALCRKQERAFAARLPDADALVAALQRQHAREMGLYDTPNGVAEHTLEALRADGAPEWTITAMRRLGKAWGRIR